VIERTCAQCPRARLTRNLFRIRPDTYQQIVVIIVALTAVELFLIYFLSRRLSQPIEDILQEFKSVESLSFEHSAKRTSKVREIAQLQSAASLLRNSLQSFSSFAPVDVV